MASYTLNLGTVEWIATPGLWALGFLYYADAMRLVFLPQYKLNLQNVLKLLGIIFILFGLVVLCSLSLAAAIAQLPLAPQTYICFVRARFTYCLYILAQSWPSHALP